MSGVRAAAPADAAAVARLLDAFNREFATPTPGVEVLTRRLRVLLAGDLTVALLADDPPSGTALVTLRPNVWYDGPVGRLDELYVVPPLRSQGRGTALLRAAEQAVLDRGGSLLEIEVDEPDTGARRFYERHGYVGTEPGTDDRFLSYYRELA